MRSMVQWLIVVDRLRATAFEPHLELKEALQMLKNACCYQGVSVSTDCSNSKQVMALL